MIEIFRACLVHSAYLVCEQCAQERIATLERDLAAARTGAASYMHDMEQAQAELAAAQGKARIADECYTSLRQELADCKPYLKEGETVTERLARYHNEVTGLMGQLAAAQAIIVTYKEDYSDLMTENRRVVDERDQARTELAAAQAEAAALRKIVNGDVAHIYQGQCPDEDDWSARDPDCHACQILGPYVNAIYQARGGKQ